jgi:JmjC domain, hydroxylase
MGRLHILPFCMFSQETNLQAERSVHGSTTTLHMDKSGALNVLLHADDAHMEKNLHGAEWFIWPSESIPSLSKVLCPTAAEAEPIVSEMYSVNPEQRRRLFHEFGYAPWHILQKPGDAVFIPPRHPHEVSVLLLLKMFKVI